MHEINVKDNFLIPALLSTTVLSLFLLPFLLLFIFGVRSPRTSVEVARAQSSHVTIGLLHPYRP